MPGYLKNGNKVCGFGPLFFGGGSNSQKKTKIKMFDLKELTPGNSQKVDNLGGGGAGVRQFREPGS